MKLQQLENKIRELVPLTIKRFNVGQLNETYQTQEIQLHHVLQALKRVTGSSLKEPIISAHGALGTMYDTQSPVFMALWDLTKDLSGQNEKTIEFISNLINK